uniref:Uncharacterized protein n=1 Tax=Anguilla anguilla TaxID=7936 RepID=A0A0E9UDA7_ANGAN
MSVLIKEPFKLRQTFSTMWVLMRVDTVLSCLSLTSAPIFSRAGSCRLRFDRLTP